MAKISVIGGGAWGTALASVMACEGEQVLLYAREVEAVESINKSSENKPFLPNIKLPKNLSATSNISEALNSEVILLTTPAQFFRKQLEEMAKNQPNKNSIFLICSKGIENNSLALMSNTFEEILDNQYCIFSGPTFAEEVARGISTSISLASNNLDIAEKVKKIIERKSLRIHINNDVVGSQICGAVKNVIAIASGIVKGLGQGENSRAAILTIGFNEIMKINQKLGGQDKTMLEPCGIGDLILTCGSEKSRNFSFGYALGQRKSKEELLANRLSVVEGVATGKSVVSLAEKLNINLPLCQKINAIIEGKSDPVEILSLV
jgi:glycerol-3-phosphate dehydrogenase (NAD(P)+)